VNGLDRCINDHVVKRMLQNSKKKDLEGGLTFSFLPRRDANRIGTTRGVKMEPSGGRVHVFGDERGLAGQLM